MHSTMSEMYYFESVETSISVHILITYAVFHPYLYTYYLVYKYL